MISRTKRLTSTLTGLALTAAALAGCTGGTDADVDQPATAAQGATTTQSAPAAPSPSVDEEDGAIAAAKEALDAYKAMEDEAYSTPDSFDVNQFEKVAVGQALIDVQGLFNTWVTDGFRSTGAQSWKVLDASANLASKPKAEPPIHPTVDLTVCVDVSAVQVVDENGESQVAEDAMDRVLTHIAATNLDYPDGTWRVSDVRYPQELQSC